MTASPAARPPDPPTRVASPPINWTGAAVAGVGGYELVADALNSAMGERLLPSLLGALQRFTVRGLLRRVFPTWVRVAGLFAFARPPRWPPARLATPARRRRPERPGPDRRRPGRAARADGRGAPAERTGRGTALACGHVRSEQRDAGTSRVGTALDAGVADRAAPPAAGRPPSGRERGRGWRPLRTRDFALLWSGQSVSLVGDGIFVVALAIEALRLGNGADGLAFVMAARMLPMVIFLFVSGAAADRLPRRLILLASDLVRGVSVGLIAVLTATHDLQLWQLVVMSAVFGSADAFFMPAATAIVPDILPVDLLSQASALESSSWVISQNLIGPALGGLVIALFGSATSFGIDAASFGVSAACIAVMHRRPPPEREPSSIMADLREGARYVRSQRWLWAAILAASVANFAGYAPSVVLIPVLVRHVLHGSATELGLVLAASGAGGLVGTVAVGHFGPPRRRITVMWLAWCLSSLARSWASASRPRCGWRVRARPSGGPCSCTAGRCGTRSCSSSSRPSCSAGRAPWTGSCRSA